MIFTIDHLLQGLVIAGFIFGLAYRGVEMIYLRRLKRIDRATWTALGEPGPQNIIRQYQSSKKVADHLAATPQAGDQKLRTIRLIAIVLRNIWLALLFGFFAAILISLLHQHGWL